MPVCARGAGQNHFVAQPGVSPNNRLQADRVDQVALVDADDRPHAPLCALINRRSIKFVLSTGLAAEARISAWVILAAIICSFPLVPRFSGATRIDPLDDPVLAIDGLEQDTVARDDGAALVAAHGADDAAHRAFVDATAGSRRRGS